MTTVIWFLVAFGAPFLAAGAFGFCSFCKNFTNEYEHGQFEGGFKYVADQEHDDSGQPLTGSALETSRRMEQVFFPLCYWPNRLLGRTKADGRPA